MGLSYEAANFVRQLHSCFEDILTKIKKSNIISNIKENKEGGMMSNIADMIESYILRQLAARQDGKVELRRTDIADEISCAPSQISYVLSTRFTQDKGFVVESRRGLGGFIRIVQVPLRDLVYRDMMSKIDENTDCESVQSMLRYLMQHGMIETREAALMLQMVTGLFHAESLDAKERVQMLKTMFLTLEKFT